MPNTTTALTAAGETYFADLERVRASGGATGERSSYGPLANLLNAVGATLAPKVFCVGELADQGAGHPDFGLYAAKQVQQGRPRDGQVPERGVVEVKAAGDDTWLTAAGDQVSRYWGRYRLVLVTNTRDFVLVGEDAAGRPTRLETFRLADDADTFVRRLETPRAFAREVGAGLGEYLTRALSHRAARGCRRGGLTRIARVRQRGLPTRVPQAGSMFWRSSEPSARSEEFHHDCSRLSCGHARTRPRLLTRPRASASAASSFAAAACTRPSSTLRPTPPIRDDGQTGVSRSDLIRWPPLPVVPQGGDEADPGA